MSCPSLTTSVSSTSGRTISTVLASLLTTDSAVYQDRSFKFTALGSQATQCGCQYVFASNDDKATLSTNIMWTVAFSGGSATAYVHLWDGSEHSGFANWPSGAAG